VTNTTEIVKTLITTHPGTRKIVGRTRPKILRGKKPEFANKFSGFSGIGTLDSKMSSS
jgi:hypothetical protein